MFDSSDFRSSLDHYMNDCESYTKEDLYDAYLEMTERYLNELINMRNIEAILIKQLGEEDGEALIENIYTSNPSISKLDYVNATETDRKKVILNLLAFLENEQSVNEASEGEAGSDNRLLE